MKEQWRTNYWKAASHMGQYSWIIADWVLGIELKALQVLYRTHGVSTVSASAKCGICNTGGRRKIRLIEGNAKRRYLKKLTFIGTLRQVFICLRPPPPLGFCLGWCSNFVGSESGQKQSVKLLQNMVSNTTQHHHPPATNCLYTVFCSWTLGREWGGGLNQREG